jgi:hypothetical protein
MKIIYGCFSVEASKIYAKVLKIKKKQLRNIVLPLRDRFLLTKLSHAKTQEESYSLNLWLFSVDSS